MKLPLKIGIAGKIRDADDKPVGHNQADYIVNAVNTHARLLEALEEVCSWDWKALRNASGSMDWDYALKDMERAAKALAAAKGDSHD